MVLLTTHSPYVLSVVNVLMAAAMVKEKGQTQDVIAEDYLLPSSSITGYYIDGKGRFQSIIDLEIPMLSGNDLDGVSDWVEESISKLNEKLFVGA